MHFSVAASSAFLVSKPRQQTQIIMMSLPANALDLLPLFCILHVPEALVYCLFLLSSPPPLCVTPLPSLFFSLTSSSLGYIYISNSSWQVHCGAKCWEDHRGALN